ncbi:MAG: hypothetical protein QOF61_260 [Acidobacteriota bacterium]|nr:hypothetical protein [Acidobacteriota bacterium]
MKSVKFCGRIARRFGVRLVTLTLACMLALAGGSVVPFGASAQQKAQSSSKTTGAGTKIAPTSAQSRGTFKDGAAKASAASGGDVTPQVLGCGNATQAVTIPQTVNGTLSNTDCANPIDGSFYDAYSFTGTAGQQVVITMTSTAFDTYLYLMRPGETTISSDPNVTIQDDDSAGGTNSRLPSLTTSLFFTGTLPTTGTYTILANSFDVGATGAYTLSITGGTTCTPTTTPIAANTTANGALSSTDCTLDDGSFYDVYTFSGTAGQQVAVSMSASFDTFLFLVAPDGDEIARDDNGAGGTNARIPAGTAELARLPQTGTYRIIANSFSAGTTGSYTVTLTTGAGNNCPPTAMSFGQTVNGTLQIGDCRLPADSSFIDVYTFSGSVGQTISIAMNSSTFDAYLFLLAPGGSILKEDNNGSGGTNARIPAGSGTLTLTSSGTYTIYANSATAGLTGNYSLTLTGSAAACTYTLGSPSRAVGAGGGTFSDAFTTQAGCAAPTVVSNSAFITGVSATVNASGQGSFSYTVAANTTAAARTGTITVGSQTFTVNQDAPCAVDLFPSVQPFGQAGGTGRFSVFPTAQCSWTVATTTPWIHIIAPSAGVGTGKGRVRYTVDPNGSAATRTGTITVGTRTFIVTETSAGTTPQIQFSSATYSVSENDPSRSITITLSRLGDTAGAASVEYRTVDDPAAVPCNTANGTAYARCDYATTVDTLTFNAGETTKSFTIPLINDVHIEGAETFQVALANAQGASLGTPATATVTINDDDTATPTTNPSHNQSVTPGQTAFFVRMQYLDFLSREPEPGEPWTAVYAPCPNQDNTQPSPNPNAACDRIQVSSAFFLSQEFQSKGFFVFLYYKVSFATQSNPNFFPQYDEFIPDVSRVTGSSPNEVSDKKANFAEDWVNRTAFKNRYDALSNTAFVDTLLSNVGASLTTPDPNSGGQTRNSLIAALDGGTQTRADVLRIIVESQEVNSLQFKHAFVAMQYYGYLRRTPEPGGYQAWLSTISPPTSANPRDMVNGFVNSDEYYLRFGPNVRQ